MPSRSYALLLSRIRRASAVSFSTFCRLLPMNSTSHSIRPYRLQPPFDCCRIVREMWRSLVALSRLVARVSLWGQLLGLPIEHCKLDINCVVQPQASSVGLTSSIPHSSNLYTCLCVCVCVCAFIKLHITAQSGPVILVILCHSH